VAAETVSADVVQYISLRDQTLERRCENARLTNEAFRAIATNDRKRHDELAAEIKALDSDPEQRALATRSNELVIQDPHGEDLDAIRAMTDRHRAPCLGW
jgi:hypothetical protein